LARDLHDRAGEADLVGAELINEQLELRLVVGLDSRDRHVFHLLPPSWPVAWYVIGC
jgi:hypothetical protein